MPQRDPVEDIRRPYERVKDVTVVLYIILWNRGHDGYLWVYPSVVINIAPGSGNINTTIQTPDGGFLRSLCPGPVTCLMWMTVG